MVDIEVKRSKYYHDPCDGCKKQSKGKHCYEDEYICYEFYIEIHDTQSGWYLQTYTNNEYMYYNIDGIHYCPWCGVRLDDITTKFWNNLTAKEMKEKYEMIDDG